MLLNSHLLFELSSCSIFLQVYFSMNSLDTCLEILKILPTQFDLNRCICNLGMEGTEVTQEQAQESLDAVIQASKEDTEKKLETMFDYLEGKVKLTIMLLIMMY